MKYAEHTLFTLMVNGEEFVIFRRDFTGARIRHGEYVEWPVLVSNGINPATGKLKPPSIRFAEYAFNGERSISSPNANLPAELKEFVVQHFNQM